MTAAETEDDGARTVLITTRAPTDSPDDVVV